MSLWTTTAATDARAQEEQAGLDAHGFQLAALDGDPRDPMAVHRPGSLQRGSWFIGGVMEYAHAPMVMVERDASGATTTSPFLDHLVALDLSGGVAVHERVRLDLTMPVYFASFDRLGAYQGVQPGDLRVNAMALLVTPDADDRGLGVGLSAHIDLPTGAEGRFLGQRSVAGGARASATWGGARWTVGGEVGLQLNPRTEIDNLTNPDHVLLGLAGGWLIRPDTGLNLELRAAPPLKKSLVAGTESPAEAMLSARHRWSNGGHLVVGAGAGLLQGVGAPRARLVIGGGFGRVRGAARPEPGTEPARLLLTTTHDGQPVPDAMVMLQSLDGESRQARSMPDALPIPVEPDSTWQAVAWTGCLVGEGSAEHVHGDVALPIELQSRLNAPLRFRVTDNRGAPVPDATVTWQPEPTGCTPSEPLALDQAGLGAQDVGAGPHVAYVEAPGYGPRRVPVDAVASVPTPVDVQLDPARVRVEADQLVILDRVYFDLEKATIKPESYGLLEEVSTVLLAHPELGRIEVGGHTDWRGSDDYNLDLSQRRADAVRLFLIERGVSAARLSAVGYGEARPIADNGTEAGMDLNRRVELRRLDSGAELRGAMPR